MREQIWLRWCYGNLSLISNPKWAKLKINNDRNVFTFDWIRWVCACFECKRGAILFSIILFFFIIHVVLFSISFCALSCAELKIILCGFSAPRHWRLAERSKIKTIRKKRINATKRKPPRWDAIWRRRRVICRWNWLTASMQSTHTVPRTHTHMKPIWVFDSFDQFSSNWQWSTQKKCSIDDFIYSYTFSHLPFANIALSRILKQQFP